LEISIILEFCKPSLRIEADAGPSDSATTLQKTPLFESYSDQNLDAREERFNL
jgi:hypothetical protein